MSSFDAARVRRIGTSVAQHVDADDVGGVAWLAACGDDVQRGVAGHLTRGEPAPVARDSIFRIASITKPIAAVAALSSWRSTDCDSTIPSTGCFPELADRRVLVDAAGRSTVRRSPPQRPITVHDVLTFRTGHRHGLRTHRSRSRSCRRWTSSGSAPRPPAPQVRPLNPTSGSAGSEHCRCSTNRVQRWTLPLQRRRARCARRPRGRRTVRVVLRDRVLRPLGMVDTAFAATDVARFGSSYERNPATGEPVVFDPARRPVGDAARVPVGRRRPGVDRRRPARVRPHAPRRRPPPGRRSPALAAAVDAMTTDQLDVLGGAPGRPRRFAGVGLRRGRAAAPNRVSAHRRHLRMDRRARVVVGQRPEPRRRRHHAHHRRVRGCVPAARGHPGLLDRRVRLAGRLITRLVTRRGSRPAILRSPSPAGRPGRSH